MKSVTRLYLDTNIFIYFLEEESPRNNLLSQLFTVNRGPLPLLVTSELTLSELLVKPYQNTDDVAIDRCEGLIMTSDWLDVFPVVRSTLAYAAVLRAKNRKLKLPDAIHLSAAIGANCSHFLTADLGITEEYELMPLKYGITHETRPLTIIRPDEPTLTSLLQSLSP